MAKAKKLASGQWRTLVYSHTDADKKRHYESFTAETKRESEYLAAEFAVNRHKVTKTSNLTVKEGMEQYITLKEAVLSPTTIKAYKHIVDHAFPSIMNIPLNKLTEDLIQNAVNEETKRAVSNRTGKVLTPKTVCNEYGFLASIIKKYSPGSFFNITLPQRKVINKELIEPSAIFEAVRGTNIELAVLLAMWLSFSQSEIRGLTKSSISPDGNYITIKEVVVVVGNKHVRKDQAKNVNRNRKHRIPEYIKTLIEKIDTDILVPMTGSEIYKQFTRALKDNNLPHMSFHDLRHVNASVMAMLNIPDKYAQERGGWKTDTVMKNVYTHTFSKEREKVDSKIDEYFNKKLQKPEDNHKYRVIENFDYNLLLDLEYFVHPREGGYLSSNLATIVYSDKLNHVGEVMLFDQHRIDQHIENVKELCNLGLVTK